MRFLIGVALGIGLGAAVGLLVAPQPGSETRRVIRQRVRGGAEDAENMIEDEL
jgi:gas vesicle protein